MWCASVRNAAPPVISILAWRSVYWRRCCLQMHATSDLDTCEGQAGSRPKGPPWASKCQHQQLRISRLAWPDIDERQKERQLDRVRDLRKFIVASSYAYTPPLDGFSLSQPTGYLSSALGRLQQHSIQAWLLVILVSAFLISHARVYHCKRLCGRSRLRAQRQENPTCTMSLRALIISVVRF